MKQRQREQVQRGCAVGTVVLLAWLCRVLPLEGLPSGLQEACGRCSGSTVPSPAGICNR